MLTKSEFLDAVIAAAGSQTAAGKAVGLPPSRINEMVKGKRDLSFDEAMKFASRYGIDVTGGTALRAAPTSAEFALLEALLAEALPTWAGPSPLNDWPGKILEIVRGWLVSDQVDPTKRRARPRKAPVESLEARQPGAASKKHRTP